MLIAECVWCYQRAAIDDMAEKIVALLRKFREIGEPEDAETLALWVSGFKGILDWYDAWFRLKFDNLMLSEADATALRASKAIMDDLRAGLVQTEKRLPTMRRNLRLVPERPTP